MKGGKRIGSGRKPGVTDGRKQITIRIKAEILEKLKPKQIRDLIEAYADNLQTSLQNKLQTTRGKKTG